MTIETTCWYCGRSRKGICNTCRKDVCASHWEVHKASGHDIS